MSIGVVYFRGLFFALVSSQVADACVFGNVSGEACIFLDVCINLLPKESPKDWCKSVSIDAKKISVLLGKRDDLTFLEHSYDDTLKAINIPSGTVGEPFSDNAENFAGEGLSLFKYQEVSESGSGLFTRLYLHFERKFVLSHEHWKFIFAQ